MMHMLKRGAIPFQTSQVHTGEAFNTLMKGIGDAEVVMIGEASHGTKEFYDLRAEITKRLIAEKGFTCIAVEADWPDAYRVNRYVQNGSTCRDKSALESLGDFRSRFPLWMWRNNSVLSFVEWLRHYNDTQKTGHDKVAFYGMDLYSMYSSMQAVVEYLNQVSPEDAKRAKAAYSSFDSFQGNPHQYGFWTGLTGGTLESQVVNTLEDLREKGEEYLKGVGGLIDGDELFYAQQNAQLVKNAEEYYRKMYHPDAITWNIRDKHFADCVSGLLDFHREKIKEKRPKIVIWAHNSHIGDARASKENVKANKWNVGQLLRERYGLERTFNIGFGTSIGSVTAASHWDEPAQRFILKPGIQGSYEELFHYFKRSTGIEQFMILMRSNTKEGQEHVDEELVKFLEEAKYERYIGVVYKPQTQRASHCTSVSLSKEYDAYLYLDYTNAVTPIDPTSTFPPA